MLPITIGILALVALLFAVLRITVTRSEVIVQYGLFGPRIPVSAIQDCQAVKYNWMTYGGWGIRRGRDGSWAYNMVGDAGRAVRIEWTDTKGKKQVTLVASPNPDALARAVNEARGRRGGAGPRGGRGRADRNGLRGSTGRERAARGRIRGRGGGRRGGRGGRGRGSRGVREVSRARGARGAGGARGARDALEEAPAS
jgi:hypothetical protein